MAHDVCRQALKKHLGEAAFKGKSPNAGLLLRRGMTHYDGGKNKGDAGKGGSTKQQLIEHIAELTPSLLYRTAFRRWQQATSDATRFSAFDATLDGRLYIGVSRESALETGLTVHHAYGMPMIPGSALKGLARAVARARLGERDDAITWLFGADTHADDAEAGGLVFHDAWWVPEGDAKPFVAEVVTPHHRDYYQGKGKPATDFDDPVPAPQIAVQGQFHFVLEGEPAWGTLACSLLKSAMAERGIGGKRSSGYGYFSTT